MGAMIILRRCREAQGEMRSLQRRIQQRREAMTCITVAPEDGGGSTGGGCNDRYASFVGAIDEYETLLKQRERRYHAELSAACVLLDSLPEPENRVLYAYYVKRDKAAAIAVGLNFSESYVRRIKYSGEKLLRAMAPDWVLATLPDWYLQMEEQKETITSGSGRRERREAPTIINNHE